MKNVALLSALLALAAGPAAAAEAAAWDNDGLEFKYFQEQGIYTEDSWEGLPADTRENALENAKLPAIERRRAELADYAAINRKWGLREADENVRALTIEKIKSVYLWVGNKEGQELSRKVRLVRATITKASAGGIDKADELALAPYLLPAAINDMRAMKLAAEITRRQNDGVKPAGPASRSTVKLDKFMAGAPSLNAGKLSNLYTGSKVSGDEAVALSAGARLPGSGAPNATRAKTIKYAPPAALDENGRAKSTAWTSDAYGITLETTQGVKTFRKGSDAEAAIKQLPDGSVKKIIMYGHGAPNVQTVGPQTYSADTTTGMMKGKMAKDGVIEFSGCNTASIGEPTLNPAVGLSMVVRRLFYFSVPYFQDRADGVPAPKAKERWENWWNGDLARDTSKGVKGAIVCGYRTFGLAPGRMPGLTRVLGNQEDTTPGYVAGKKACYRDGKEVPVP